MIVTCKTTQAGRPLIVIDKKVAVIYGVAIAAAAFGLRWLEYQHSVRLFATEIYIVCIAVVFAGLGIWIGNQLTRRKAPGPFEKNLRALESLGVTKREYDALLMLEKGLINKEIAAKLHISPNTVKTHLAHLYEKLGASRRTEALRKARALRLIP